MLYQKFHPCFSIFLILDTFLPLIQVHIIDILLTYFAIFHVMPYMAVLGTSSEFLLFLIFCKYILIVLLLAEYAIIDVSVKITPSYWLSSV